MSKVRVALTGAAITSVGAVAALVVSVAAAQPRQSFADTPPSAAGGSPSAVTDVLSPPDRSTDAVPSARSLPPSGARVPGDAHASDETRAPTSAPPTSNALPRPRATGTPRRAPVPSTAPAHPAKPAAPSAKPHAAPRVAAPAPVRGQPLPLGYQTGRASRVITVVAPSTGSTTATLQAWQRASGGGWLRHGGAVTAHVGEQGLTTHPSESRSATPIGSFTMTQAFGADLNPGTGLPYFQTDGADWWISQAGPLYNTHQHCWSGCGFVPGAPNEHLAYERPYYNYVVVIDYNRSPVVQGAGSAFFLHVTDGAATAGCVAIPQASLVSIMRWLTPAAAPRILIGVA